MNDLETIYDYIDNRTDVERDRLLMHPPEKWYSARNTEYGIRGNESCVVGVAECVGNTTALEIRELVAYAYDSECRRRGVELTVRDIKARAGATLPTEIEHPTKPLEAVVGV